MVRTRKHARCSPTDHSTIRAAFTVNRSRYSVWRDVELPANLPADRVLLLTEGLLLAFDDMAVVEFGHGAYRAAWFKVAAANIGVLGVI